MEICKKAKIEGKPFKYPGTDKIRVFATTVIRCTRNNELTGYLLEIDRQRDYIKENSNI